VFRRWRASLKDERTRGLIASRLDRLAFGNAGDVKPVGQGVSELRIDYGPGYRLYFKRHDEVIIVLLCGGEKKTQDRDIRTAKRLAEGWNKDYE
jgi:putative addiction module killer protein